MLAGLDKVGDYVPVTAKSVGSLRHLNMPRIAPLIVDYRCQAILTWRRTAASFRAKDLMYLMELPAM